MFYNSYGRTDLGNSNPIDMVKSLNRLWKELKEENLILPGHNK
ncbi:MAG: MBL fold metallo-hydrolase [Mycoplasmoidaceae bacterium]|nr:MBL fold metallo-hydrolase [Mycoplasmoidaceae bacterium]